MKLTDFIQKANGKISFSTKGAHDKFLLGFALFPGNERDYTATRRKYGTMVNKVILHTVEEMNDIFNGSGLIFEKTKSALLCWCTKFFEIVEP